MLVVSCPEEQRQDIPNHYQDGHFDPAATQQVKMLTANPEG